MNKYGECSNCGAFLEPVWFIEEEVDSKNIATGRRRQAVDYLICPVCLKSHVVDDSFDKPWRMN